MSFTGWLINVGHKRIIDLYQPCYKCKLSYSSMFYVLYWTSTKKSFPISVIYVGGLHHYYLDSFGFYKQCFAIPYTWIAVKIPTILVVQAGRGSYSINWLCHWMCRTKVSWQVPGTWSVSLSFVSRV